MNKKAKHIIEGILFILIIAGFIYIGNMDFSSKKTVDNERFDQDFSLVSKDNVFKYASASDIYSTLKKDGIIFMGYKENIWTGYYARILNDVAKELNIKEILYYDFYEDRKMGNATYQSIVLKLSNYLPTLDDDTQDIYAPTLIVVKNGLVVSFDNETAIKSGTLDPDAYWTDLKVGLKKENLKAMLRNY